jgi:Lar family restriction alleviation protein
MAELKPCRLCGGEAEIVKLFPTKRYDCFVHCTQCGAEGKAYSSKQNAVKAWNRRFDNG